MELADAEAVPPDGLFSAVTVAEADVDGIRLAVKGLVAVAAPVAEDDWLLSSFKGDIT